MGGKTRVETATDLTLTGTVGQYGRGMVEGVAAQLLTEFAQCLERKLAAQPESPAADAAAAAAEPADAPAKPVSGLTVGLRALWSSLTSLVHRR